MKPILTNIMLNAYPTIYKNIINNKSQIINGAFGIGKTFISNLIEKKALKTMNCCQIDYSVFSGMGALAKERRLSKIVNKQLANQTIKKRCLIIIDNFDEFQSTNEYEKKVMIESFKDYEEFMHNDRYRMIVMTNGVKNFKSVDNDILQSSVIHNVFHDPPTNLNIMSRFLKTSSSGDLCYHSFYTGSIPYNLIFVSQSILNRSIPYDFEVAHDPSNAYKLFRKIMHALYKINDNMFNNAIESLTDKKLNQFIPLHESIINDVNIIDLYKIGCITKTIDNYVYPTKLCDVLVN